MEKELHQFISELINEPIKTERFTASFVQTTPNGGELRFQHQHSKKLATAKWEAHEDQQKVYGILKYNERFIILRADSAGFKKEIAEKLPVF